MSPSERIRLPVARSFVAHSSSLNTVFRVLDSLLDDATALNASSAIRSVLWIRFAGEAMQISFAHFAARFEGGERGAGVLSFT